jgi:uncharacterized protein (DUF305 family)
MRMPNAGWLLVIPIAAQSLAGCAGSPAASGPLIVAAGAPGERSRTVDPAAATTAERADYVEADVRFMQDMIRHHAQALEMTRLVAERTEDGSIRRVAQRIDASQQDEIATMRRWLEARGEATAPGAAHAGHQLMPGMLTPEAMAALAAARGEDFDRLFLESMIRHHEGALVMVRDLFAMGGAGREPELYRFATHVDADQRAEIARMRSMLNQNDERGSV